MLLNNFPPIILGSLQLAMILHNSMALLPIWPVSIVQTGGGRRGSGPGHPQGSLFGGGHPIWKIGMETWKITICVWGEGVERSVQSRSFIGVSVCHGHPQVSAAHSTIAGDNLNLILILILPWCLLHFFVCYWNAIETLSLAIIFLLQHKYNYY